MEKTRDKAAIWINECNKFLNNKTLIDTSNKNVYGASALLHSLKYHEAIIVLGDYKPEPLYSPALSLLRPQFENYIHGVWILRCAKEVDIILMEKINFNWSNIKNIKSLIDDIENENDFKSKKLSEIKNETWDFFCNFCHGGGFQLNSQINFTELKYIPTKEHLNYLYHQTSEFTLLAINEYAFILNNSLEEINILINKYPF